MGPKPKNESDGAFIVWDAKIVAVECGAITRDRVGAATNDDKELGAGSWVLHDGGCFGENASSTLRTSRKRRRKLVSGMWGKTFKTTKHKSGFSGFWEYAFPLFFFLLSQEKVTS